MNVDVLITADLSNTAGKKLVVYEYLYQIVDGKEILISSHEDIHDEKQTNHDSKTGDPDYSKR